ncbi:hypothetical protein LTR15_004000 [Elasticomyces elasticus]|nr:hypothetical protein LTR15_004000 [Elasticomyces elasticus]
MRPTDHKDPQAQKQALIVALNEHRINTIGELRRVERIFATLGSPDLTQPMTAAYTLKRLTTDWSRGIFRQLKQSTYGTTRAHSQLSFQVKSAEGHLYGRMLMISSSECLDEAKRRVHADPASNRSWNYCWLVLAKAHTDRLIPAYARAQAARPEMWGGRIPPDASVTQLTEAFVKEWNAALAQMLRYWEEPPIR